MVLRQLLTLCLSITLGYTLQAQTFTLMSEDVGGQATEKQEFNAFGCNGENVSPQLSWENAPEGTKSFAITMYDPDAPTGSGFWHWVIVDIPADATTIPAGAGSTKKNMLPKGALQTVTSYGAPGYGGPCPPKGHGIHEYMITIHALDTEQLGVKAKTNPAVVGFNLWQHTLAKASIVMYYSRD